MEKSEVLLRYVTFVFDLKSMCTYNSTRAKLKHTHTYIHVSEAYRAIPWLAAIYLHVHW